ncbi:MAG: hydroxyethylthiazole kinase [Candidimonas sp.]|nr:MAG: hydroxyethylthiazole kinase [Candidimonas sp.]TAM23942.1 MAG: hydroxyethylthiazole kinase [Candidimonas sp.]
MAENLTHTNASASTSGILFSALRLRAPLVQCITNYVAMNFAANVLLATGASPAMVHSSEEAGEFASFADALTINIGTLSPEWLDGMLLAAKAATSVNTPWVLDPVAHHATAFRRRAVAELLELRPTVIRGNASEIIALAGGETNSRGVDSKDGTDMAEGCAKALAQATQAVIAVTGAVDFVTDGKRATRILGGSPLMTHVTAMGCALTCLVGAFTAISRDDPFTATVAALSCFGAAGANAACEASGPGSFSWRFLDALAMLDNQSINAQARPVTSF